MPSVSQPIDTSIFSEHDIVIVWVLSHTRDFNWLPYSIMGPTGVGKSTVSRANVSQVRWTELTAWPVLQRRDWLRKRSKWSYVLFYSTYTGHPVSWSPKTTRRSFRGYSCLRWLLQKQYWNSCRDRGISRENVWTFTIFFQFICSSSGQFADTGQESRYPDFYICIGLPTIQWRVRLFAASICSWTYAATMHSLLLGSSRRTGIYSRTIMRESGRKESFAKCTGRRSSAEVRKRTDSSTHAPLHGKS